MRVKSESRRQGIVEIARGVFQELGFEAASMSVIAARVGGSKATLYSYFASKDDLFVEVMRQFAEELMKNVFEDLDPERELAVNLQAFGERFLLATCTPELVSAYRNVIAVSAKSSVGRLFFERGPLVGLQDLATYFEGCMARGKLRTLDPMTAAQQLFGLLRAEASDRLLLGVVDQVSDEDVRAMVRRAVDLFLWGCAPGRS